MITIDRIRIKLASLSIFSKKNLQQSELTKKEFFKFLIAIKMWPNLIKGYCLLCRICVFLFSFYLIESLNFKYFK